MDAIRVAVTRGEVVEAVPIRIAGRSASAPHSASRASSRGSRFDQPGGSEAMGDSVAAIC